MNEKIVNLLADALAAINEMEIYEYERQSLLMYEYVNMSFNKSDEYQHKILSSIDTICDNRIDHTRCMINIFRLNNISILIDAITWIFGSYTLNGYNINNFEYEISIWKKAISKYVYLGENGGITRVYEIIGKHQLELLRLSERSNQQVNVDKHARPKFNRYLEAILKPSSSEAMACAKDSIGSLDDIKFLWFKVIQPAMYEIGRLWALGTITVAGEHLATSITKRVMAISYPIVFNTPKKNGNLVLTITQGELHEIGARMMAEFLEIEGWIVFYTGTNTPNESVIDLIKKVSARFLCISTTLPMNLVNTFQLISAVKSDSQLTNVKVLVGGQAYNTDPLLWQKIGADQYADSFESAVQFLDSCEDKDD